MTVPETLPQPRYWKRGPQWVCKSDIMRFRRCEYAFWLLDTGQVILEAVISEPAREAIHRGIDFETSIFERTKPLPKTVTIEKAFSADYRLFDLPTFENPELQIFGVPDGIETADGQLFPVEIKGRERSSFSDRLELAFYWMLLEPYRTKQPEIATGRVVLQTPDGPQTLTIELRPAHFGRVRELIEEVRRVRQEGAKPVLCRCEVCSTRPEIQERARLMCIIGIGDKYGNALFEMGIVSLKGLIEGDPKTIVKTMNMRGLGPSVVRRWQHHAQALDSGKHVYFGRDRFICPDSFIGLDVEYVSGEDVWLFGIHIHSGSESRTVQLWTDRKIERRKAIKEINAIFAQYSDAQIITWNGTSADIPYLRAAAEACGQPGMAETLDLRHFDLYRFVERNFRFPTYGLGLKSVAHHFGVTRISPIDDGLQAQNVYLGYRGNKDATEKARLREALLTYNGDDLTSLCEVISHVSKLCEQQPPEPAGPYSIETWQPSAKSLSHRRPPQEHEHQSKQRITARNTSSI